MSESLSIRQCTATDYPVVADIYNEYIRKGGSTMDDEEKTVDDIAGWVKKFNDREELHLLFKNGVPIGWGIIKRYSDRLGYRFACETAVYLTSSELGQGYGTHLKRYIMERCKALDYRHLVAKIWASNKTSIVYNQKLGYEIVGIQKNIGFKDGKWVDIAIMQCLLAD